MHKPRKINKGPGSSFDTCITDEKRQVAIEDMIEPPHHERIARSERFEGLREDGARGVGARRLFLENHIDGCARQRIGLQCCRLVVRRDPRVAHQPRRSVLDGLGIIPARQTPSWGFLWLRFRRFGRCRRPSPSLFGRANGTAGSMRGEEFVEGNSAFSF
jgi:hypothetical protein